MHCYKFTVFNCCRGQDWIEIRCTFATSWRFKLYSMIFSLSYNSSSFHNRLNTCRAHVMYDLLVVRFQNFQMECMEFHVFLIDWFCCWFCISLLLSFFLLFFVCSHSTFCIIYFYMYVDTAYSLGNSVRRKNVVEFYHELKKCSKCEEFWNYTCFFLYEAFKNYFTTFWNSWYLFFSFLNIF